MYIDTHLHLSKKEGIEPSIFIENARKAGVTSLILSCCDKESILEGLEFIKQYDSIFLSIGFHPEFAKEITENDLSWLESLIQSCPKVVAIGEIGLDYHWEKDAKQVQQQLFQKQLDLAQKYSLPVVIHTRDAIQDTYDILKRYSLRGDIHCYSGSVEMAENFIRLGYFLGIGGVVTFSNSKLYEVVIKVGLKHILLETDSPYLAPSPYRGSVNESKNIPVIAEHIASILKVSPKEVAEITTKNACTLFDLTSKL